MSATIINLNTEAQNKIDLILDFWNPSGKSFAAEYWERPGDDFRPGAKGFAPVCKNKKDRRAGCQLFLLEKACRACSIFQPVPLNADHVRQHLSGSKRFGIYPIFDKKMVSWVAADLDNHDGKQDVNKDYLNFVNVSNAIDIPFFIFSSNSGLGCHIYLFFSAPVLAIKARALMLDLIRRANIDLGTSSLDCVFPKQNELADNMTVGNLIALPWSGEAIKNRHSTVFVESNSFRFANRQGDDLNSNIEDFEEHAYERISPEQLDQLISSLEINVSDFEQQSKRPSYEDGPSALDGLIQDCAFLSHCRDDAASLSETDWYNMICILAREYNGPAMIHKLSAPYHGYTARETDIKILHAIHDQPGPITCKHIKQSFNCQKDCGVTCPIHLTRASVGIAGIEIPGETSQEETTCAGVPNALLNPGGILQEIIDYILQVTPVPVPIYALANALSLLGTVAGHKICGPTGIRTNLYSLVLGYSGSGKDGPQRVVADILSDTKELAHLKGPSKVTGGAGVYSTITEEDRQHCKLFIFDEFAKILKRERTTNNPAETVGTAFLELFSGAGGVKGYADKRFNRYYPWQHVSLIASTTPEDLWEQMTPTDLKDGFIARLQVFESRHDPKTAAYDVPLYNENKPKRLLQRLIEINQIPWQLDPDCIGNVEKANAPKYIPYRLQRTPSALEFLKDWDRKQNQLQCEHKGSWKGYIYNRSRETGEKYAQIHHASKFGSGCISQPIGLDSYQYGLSLISMLDDNMIRSAESHISEGQWHSWEQEIVRIIKKYATTQKPGLSRSVLFSSYAKKVPGPQREPLIDGMLKIGKLVEIEYKPKRGPSTTSGKILCLPKKQENSDD